MATTQKYLLGSQGSIFSTDLNSLANNALVLSASAYNNTVGGGSGEGYVYCDLELVVTFGTNPTAGTAISFWFLTTSDGTNYEDGGTSVTPARAPDLVIPVRAVTTAQRIIRRCLLPWGNFKVLIKNDGTGQAFSSSGNTVKLRPVTLQAV